MLRLGRNMNQCLQAAETMFQLPMHAPQSLKRKSLDTSIEHSPKRIATMPQLPALEPLAPGISSPISTTLPPLSSISTRQVGVLSPITTNPQHVNIQPRPMDANGYLASASQHPPPLPPPPPPVRKRGRPSRADRARQLRPILPQHLTPLAPHPTPVTPIAPHPITIPTATGPAQESNVGTPSSSYSASPGPVGSQRGRKRGRPPSSDKFQPVSLVIDVRKIL
jgi:hypothetical protein